MHKREITKICILTTTYYVLVGWHRITMCGLTWIVRLSRWLLWQLQPTHSAGLSSLLATKPPGFQCIRRAFKNIVAHLKTSLLLSNYNVKYSDGMLGLTQLCIHWKDA